MTSRARAVQTIRWLTADDVVLLEHTQMWGKRRGGKGYGLLRATRMPRRKRVREMAPAELRWRRRS